MDRHIVAIINPKSSNARRVATRIKKLEGSLATTITQVETSPDSVIFKKTLTDAFKKYSTEPTIYLVGGGDGTVHDVVSVAITSNHKHPENIILMPIWGGNANDFAYMLNGLGLRKDMSKLLARAKPVKIHPLEIERSYRKKVNVDYAICYASFGASAFAADIIDKEGPARKGKFSNIGALVVINELVRVVSAFLHAPPFRAQVNGERVEIFEQVFTNGSRIAKVDRLPVNLTDKAFYKVAQPSKHPVMILRILRLLTGGKQVGEITDQPVTFQVKEDVLGQFDGEVTKVPKNTTVSIKLSDKYIYALSTKLNN